MVILELDPPYIDFTEIEAALRRRYGQPPFGTRDEVVMGHVLNAEFLIGWEEGALVQ